MFVAHEGLLQTSFGPRSHLVQTSFGPRSKNSFWECGHLNAWCCCCWVLLVLLLPLVVVGLVPAQEELGRNDPAVGFGHWCEGLLLEAAHM